ncbi:uncharacterized protein C8R40DRAFT_1169266 [Lentinula edodes]|uniref:uncharacterized protein n=1 Tax=Lentinula edodes TaxID=5353 RepID=UPI001E8E93AE|nr:uncharacterized protein C8R40DRAFT_1169266 [Lentinula edodes]KAH7876754.1 hypothetical protein C8R40DRAFT_1169266 [Lentinula edodes]
MSRQSMLSSAGTLRRGTPNKTRPESVNGILEPTDTDNTPTVTATKEQIAREYLTSKAAIIGTNALLTKDDIYDAMLRATRLPKKELDVALKTVEHGITLLRDMDEKQNQHQLLGEIKGAVESSFAKLDIEKQLQHQLTQVRNEFNERLDSIAANINGTEEKINSIAKNSQPAAPEASYADVMRTNGKGTMAPTQAMARQRMRAHIEVKRQQVLILNVGNEAGKEISGEILEYLNNMLIKMGALNKGTFVSATKLKNTDNLLTEVSLPELADWIHRVEQMIQFTTLSGQALTIADKEYEIILHFVLITFGADDAFELQRLEDINNLPTCSITQVKWAKAIQRQTEGQRVASLLLYLNNANAVNQLLLSGAVISNKRVEAKKTVKEERRCYKCQ